MKFETILAIALLALAGARCVLAEPSLKLTGEPEIYLSHADMRCAIPGVHGANDVPNMPVTAFRRKDGSVVVLTGNHNNYVLEGKSVESARRTSCNSLVPSINDPKPEAFNGRRWLFVIHAVNYEHVLGFAHNEYHGDDFFPDKCKVTSQHNFECWYGSTVAVTSSDGGRSFDTPAPPNNVVASLPFKFVPGHLRAGTTAPKVVGNPHDSMVYVMVNFLDFARKLKAQQCLLRGSGTRLDDWRAWNGKGFELDMRSPWAVERGPDCVPVIPWVVTSVKYVPKIDRFVALGLERRDVVYSFSPDLKSWSPPQLLTGLGTDEDGNGGAATYLSLLDPDSSSINFDTLEKRPYLFFVRGGTGSKKAQRQQDIFRQRVEIK